MFSLCNFIYMKFIDRIVSTNEKNPDIDYIMAKMKKMVVSQKLQGAQM